MRLGAWGTDDKLTAVSKQLAERARRLAEKLGVRFVDSGKWGITLAFDGVHFTEEGHRTVAKALFNWIMV